MTKQTKTLAALAAALVVCGGAYAALRVWNDQQAQVDDAVYVTQLSDLTALSLTNGQGELSFTKAVHSMSVTLETPLEVEEAITVAIMSVLCGIPADASYQLLATNNAKDAEPVWQDVTADVAAGRNIIFTNQVQANGPAFNFKLSASRSEGGQGGYVKSLKGAFQ